MDELTIEQLMDEIKQMLTSDVTILSIQTGGEVDTAKQQKCYKIVDGMLIRIRCDSPDVQGEL
jgi:hypothetical protein